MSANQENGEIANNQPDISKIRHKIMLLSDKERGHGICPEQRAVLFRLNPD